MGLQLVFLALVVVVGQLLSGFWLTMRLSRTLRLGPAAFCALLPLMGIVAVGVTTLVAGHLALLGAWLPWALLGVAAVLVALDRADAVDQVSRVLSAGWAQWRRSPVSVSAVALGLGLAVLAALAPPFRIDEIEYHWAAPLEWVSAGRWVDSSYRHVDSFPFMEIVYTYAATLDSYAGAHLVHLTTLVALGSAAAWAAGAVDVRATGAVAAGAMAMPVVWDAAYAAYNDTAVGAFSVAAAAIALHGVWSRGWVLLTCLLLGTAISIKPTAVGAVGVVGLIVLIQAIQQRRSGSHRVVRTVVRVWVPLIATLASALGVWTLRRFMLTGTWIDSALTTPPTASELTRLPTNADQLVAPVMPFVLGIVGANEPWGGRTGLVLQIFLLPAIGYAIWRRRRVGARVVRTAVPAWTHWLVVGLQGVRTRFHLLSWALLVVAVRVVVEDACRAHPRWRPWIEAAWAGSVVLGVVDSSFEMLRVIRTIDFNGGGAA